MSQTTAATGAAPAAGDGARIVRRQTARARGVRVSASAQERLLTFLSPVLFLALWEVLARTGLVDQRFFPAPSAVFQEFVKQLGSGGTLRYDTYVTVRRVLIGFVVGGVPGVVIGLGMGFIRPLRLMLDPVISMLYPIPKSSIMPLLLLIFGFGEASKWVLVAIGVFFPVVLNCMAGVLGIQSAYVDVARNYGAGRAQYLRYVAFPGALPLVLSGLRLGLGMGLVLVAIAEIVGAQDGLGYMIQHSWELFSVETMYVGLFVLGFIGIATSLLLRELERAVVPWAVERR
ncbi:ABC transporter permease [Streptomyces sp. NPDC050560]|uniref:ABC transporter permease n=1 Tax=Streptomyces sp. NPDC050560 TaxID=3365630 RepID=UPI00378D08D6